MNDRAVSEVVGFILVFSLVVSTVGVVYAVGFDGLEKSRSAEQVNNAGRAFDVMADNLEDIYGDGAPSRSSELKLSDAELSVGSPDTTIEVEVAGNGVDEEPVNVKPIRYASSARDTSFTYEGGAIFREDGSGTVMQQEPPFLISQDQTVIQYVATKSGGGTQSISGSTTVLVRAERTGRHVRVVEYGTPDVTVDMTVTTTPERAPAWERYLEEQIDWTGTDDCSVGGPNNGEVVCTFTVDELFVTTVGIDIVIE